VEGSQASWSHFPGLLSKRTEGASDLPDVFLYHVLKSAKKGAHVLVGDILEDVCMCVGDILVRMPLAKRNRKPRILMT
jgi:hypothetical protein